MKTKAFYEKQIIIGIGMFMLASRGMADSSSYDLTAGFSTVSNPNGVWSYNESEAPITAAISNSFSAGWGYYASFDASIVQLNTSVGGWFDSQAGDVIMHAPSVPYGGPSVYLDINWTSPSAGVISITGRAWDDLFADGRDANWWLAVGGTKIASRSSVYGLSRTDAAAQFTNNVLSGSSLTNIAVRQGEVVEFGVQTDTYYGHEVGVQETITLTRSPSLAITQSGNSVTISWPQTDGYTLQQNPDLTPGAWTATTNSIATSNGTNSVNITLPAANLFFRLQR